MNIDEISSLLRNTSIKSDIADFITHNKKIHRRRHSLAPPSITHRLSAPFTPHKSRQTKSRLSKTCQHKSKIRKQLFSGSNSHTQASKKPLILRRHPLRHKSMKSSHGQTSSNRISYQNLNIIGSGSFSTVYKVMDVATNTIYALKQGRKRVTIYNAHRMVSECKILSKLKYHPHIVQFQCFWIDADTHVLNQLFKYYQHGTLADLIQSNHRFSDSQIFIVLLQITRGLAHIHDTNIIHFDIKPANICVDLDYTLKIADFGISVDVTNTKHVAQSGEARYISPEIVYEEYKKNMESKYLKNCDVFALGCIVMELLLDSVLPSHGEIFHYLRGIRRSEGTNNINWKYLNEHVEDSHDDMIVDDYKLNDCNYASVFIRDMLLQMMYRDPKHRISSNELLDAICSEFDSQAIQNKMNTFKALILPSVACSKRSDSSETADFTVDTVDINNYECVNRT